MLISEDYRKEQERLHGTGIYGVIGRQYGAMVSSIIDQMEINTVLDYGCGSRRSLTETLKPKRKIQYQGYDPGVPEYAEPPVPAEMVVCCDVLEHIEPEYLNSVLDHLEDLTQIILFATVHTGPAGKTLSDGRNAHLIQQPMEWWLPKFQDRFAIQTVQKTGKKGFYVIAQHSGLEDIEE